MHSSFRMSRLIMVDLAACAVGAIVACLWSLAHGAAWSMALLLNPTFIFCLVLAAILAGLSVFYARVRRDAFLSRLLAGIALMQLAVFVGVSLSYLVPTAQFPFVDSHFARIDRQLGFDFPAYVDFAVRTPWLRDLAAPVYSLVTVLLVFVTMGYLAVTKRIDEFERAMSFIVFASLLTVSISMFFPVGSTFAYYQIPFSVEEILGTTTGASFNEYFGRVRLADTTTLEEGFRGMVSFPSFHTALGMMAVLYLRSNLLLLVPMAIGSAAMIATTPLIGGHFLVDILGGVLVSLFSFWLVEKLAGEPEYRLVLATS